MMNSAVAKVIDNIIDPSEEALERDILILSAIRKWSESAITKRDSNGIEVLREVFSSEWYDEIAHGHGEDALADFNCRCELAGLGAASL